MLEVQICFGGKKGALGVLVVPSARAGAGVLLGSRGEAIAAQPLPPPFTSGVDLLVFRWANGY